jgi:uncharacterized protein (DUF885 family)
MLIRVLYLSVFLAAGPAASASADDARTLHRVADEYFEWRQHNDSLAYPPLDTMARLSHMPVIPDISLSAARRAGRGAGGWLDVLAPISYTALSHEDQLTLDVLRWDLQNYAEAARYYWLDFPISVYGTRLAAVHDILTGYVFHGQGDAGRYLALVLQYSVLIDQMTDKMQGQLARGIVMPVGEIDVSRRFIASLVTEPRNSLWYVTSERLAQLPADQSQRFQDQVRSAIERKIIPSLRRMLAFLDGGYRTKAPTAVGLAQYKDGAAYYRWLVRFYTTEELSPEAVHHMGLAQVARLEAQLAAVQSELGIPGGFEGMRAAAEKVPRLHARSSEEVGERLNAYLRRIEPVVPHFFSKMPSAPYAVRRLGPALEGGLTFGYYQDPTPASPAGIYWYNGSSLDHRSMLTAGALIYHELIPGHHMQHSFQVDNEALPAFRRYGGSNAFDEGWATYASDVAGDMGMYTDPYDRWGLIADQLMVATRLVVDTGLNALGWSRESASEYMSAHTFLSSQEIGTETLRYSSDIPAQGLSYATVSEKIENIREREKAALGDAFDIRRFHDAVLLSGALPMPVLEKHVHWYLRQAP